MKMMRHTNKSLHVYPDHFQIEREFAIKRTNTNFALGYEMKLTRAMILEATGANI
jgi:hypothetical protein